MENIRPKLRFPEFEESWIYSVLSETGEFIGVGTPSTTNLNYWNGDINWFTPTEIKGDFVSSSYRKITSLGLINSSAKLLPVGTILLTTRATIGEVSIAKIECATNQGFQSLVTNHKHDKIFIFNWFKKNKHLLLEKANGSTFPEISKSELEKINIIFPTLPEQTKIASFLSAVDEKIAILKEKKEALEEYKKGMMQKIFSQEIRFKDENGVEFADWEEKMLCEVAEFRRGSFPQPYGLKKWYDDKNGTPFIQVYDVDDNLRLKSSTKNKISSLGAKQSVFVEEGTLIITIQGSIGRIAKTQYDAYVDRTLLIFQSYKLPIDIDYFKYVVFLLFEIEKTKAPGGIIKTITKEVLSSFNIMIPCIEEQTKIANFLTSIDEKIELVTSQIDDTQEYKKGLLQQMFV